MLIMNGLVGDFNFVRTLARDGQCPRGRGRGEGEGCAPIFDFDSEWNEIAYLEPLD